MTFAQPSVPLLEAVWRPPDLQPGDVIYVMQSIFGAFFKVGLSGDLRSRLYTISGGVPGGVRLVGWWPVKGVGRSKDVEASYHAELQRWHIGHEWFRATTESIAIITNWVANGGLSCP